MQIRVRKTDGTRRTQRDLAKLTVAKLKDELKGYGACCVCLYAFFVSAVPRSGSWISTYIQGPLCYYTIGV